MKIEEHYNNQCQTSSDINEHLPTLKRYAEECEHITEMGVRWIVSTWAFLMGNPKKMVSYDIDAINLDLINESLVGTDIDFTFIQSSTLDVTIEETDLLFLDTDHTYEQVKGELMRHGNKSKKYIIFHDTTTFGEVGMYGSRGIWHSIQEFLQENSHWTLHEKFENNNGLTILKRI